MAQMAALALIAHDIPMALNRRTAEILIADLSHFRDK